MLLEIDKFYFFEAPPPDHFHFGESVEDVRLTGTISDYENRMIVAFLEIRPVESFTMYKVKFGVSNRSAFRRIVLACSNVERLEVCGSSISRCAAIADLLRKSSILSEITLTEKMGDAQLSAIAAGLTGNTRLKKMYFSKCQGDFSSMAKALCDTSSIQGILKSNHTLEEILPMRNLHPLVRDCLYLNQNANKDEVARRKIAKYYFAGPFDVSPFFNMPVSVLPEVLSLLPKAFRRIERRKHDTNCQSAIFRMLKSIPELCNVSSRDVHAVGHADSEREGFGNKRQKIGG